MKVSVVVTTYNHERFIAQALDSVLMQETDFPYEILVTEDCSTDATRAIAGEYAARHPDRIRLFFSERNLGSNEVGARAIRAARGEYLAQLDGDDYWTSRHKLQRQGDYLDAHPGCAVCFHNATSAWEGDEATWLHNRPDQRRVTTIRDLLAFCYIAGCSPMLRRAAVAELPAWYEDAEFGDWPLYILAARSGTVDYLPDTMGHYRMHADGYWIRLSAVDRHRMTLAFLHRLERNLEPRHRGDVRTSIAVVESLLACELELIGDLPAARIAARRSLARRPAAPRIPHRDRLRILARGYTPRLWSAYTGIRARLAGAGRSAGRS